MQRTLQTMLALGVLGAISIVTASLWMGGPKLLLVYVCVGLVAAAIFRLAEIERFAERFVGCFGVYAITGLSHYASIIISKQPPIPLFGHVWRIAFLLAVGALLNALVAVAIAPNSRTHRPATA